MEVKPIELISGIVLSVEAAIMGGSVAIIRDGEVLQESSGTSTTTRSEDLILMIEAVLRNTGIEKGEIDGIAVSLGPGSFTGLRIGIASAVGLSAALGIPSSGVELFEAIAKSACNQGEWTIALPIGRTDICHQQFRDGRRADQPRVSSREAIINELPPETAVAYHESLDLLIQDHPKLSKGMNLGHNMARFIGLSSSFDRPGPLEPVYVQNPRFNLAV